MPAARTDFLARLFDILQPAPAMYLADSGFWSYPGPEELRLALADLVAAHRGILDRAALVLEEREVPVPKVAYPLSYTGWHDVDLGSMLPRILGSLQAQIAGLETVAVAPDDATAAGLASESLRINRQQIDLLEQLATKLRAGLAVTQSESTSTAS
jgi:hypothetical protein